MKILAQQAVFGVAAFGVLASLLMAASPVRTGTAADEEIASARQRDAARAAFEGIVPVLRNPRCMNCHSKGDFPRQGDGSHRHTMQVRRGPHGDGVKAVN